MSLADLRAYDERIDRLAEVALERWIEHTEMEMERSGEALEMTPREERRRGAVIHIRNSIALLNESGDQSLIPRLSQVIAELERAIGARVDMEDEP